MYSITFLCHLVLAGLSAANQAGTSSDHSDNEQFALFFQETNNQSWKQYKYYTDSGEIDIEGQGMGFIGGIAPSVITENKLYRRLKSNHLYRERHTPTRGKKVMLPPQRKT